GVDLWQAAVVALQQVRSIGVFDYRTGDVSASTKDIAARAVHSLPRSNERVVIATTRVPPNRDRLFRTGCASLIRGATLSPRISEHRHGDQTHQPKTNEARHS